MRTILGRALQKTAVLILFVVLSSLTLPVGHTQWRDTLGASGRIESLNAQAGGGTSREALPTAAPTSQPGLVSPTPTQTATQPVPEIFPTPPQSTPTAAPGEEEIPTLPTEPPLLPTPTLAASTPEPPVEPQPTDSITPTLLP